MPKTYSQTYSVLTSCSDKPQELNFLLLISPVKLCKTQGGGSTCLGEQGSELESLFHCFLAYTTKKKSSLKFPGKEESNLANRLILSSLTWKIYILLTTNIRNRRVAQCVHACAPCSRRFLAVLSSVRLRKTHAAEGNLAIVKAKHSF